MGGGGFRSFGDPSTQEIFPIHRALTYEAERTLDSPRHGAARACPWLSTSLVAGSVRRGRWGDWYSQPHTQGVESGHPRFLLRKSCLFGKLPAYFHETLLERRRISWGSLSIDTTHPCDKQTRGWERDNSARGTEQKRERGKNRGRERARNGQMRGRRQHRQFVVLMYGRL